MGLTLSVIVFILLRFELSVFRGAIARAEKVDSAVMFRHADSRVTFNAQHDRVNAAAPILRNENGDTLNLLTYCHGIFADSPADPSMRQPGAGR
jgi:hypothetical protein